MSEHNPMRIFATHAWEHSDDYFRLFEYLEATEKFFYINCSKLEPLPPEDATKADKNTMLRKQMADAEVVVVLPSTYVASRSWVELEMHMAKAMGKPVIALEPFGPDPLPDEVRAQADAVVEWNSRTIVDAMRLHARHEETQRWDVIEFE